MRPGRKDIWMMREQTRKDQIARILQPIGAPHAAAQAIEVADQAAPQKVTSCKKCGRELVRGLFMHEKHCKGTE